MTVSPELRPIARWLERAESRAPAVRLELDQCHCTVATKLERVRALHESDALVGRRVLLLGDDDLISLAIDRVVRRFGGAGTIAGLTVVDVDASIVAFLRDELRAAPFPVRCVEHDLREPLPAAFARAYDTVLTDPPFTVEGALLFLSRAAAAVAPGGSVFLSFGSRRPGAAFRVQRAILEMGFAIRQLERDFNEYFGAGVIGGTSHLYHLQATPQVRPLVTDRWKAPLYTADAPLAR